MNSEEDSDTSLERVLREITNLLTKQHETSKSINQKLEMLFDSDSSRQTVNDSMRQVLKDSMDYFSNMQETYEVVPLLLDNISTMYIENQGILNDIYKLLNEMKNKQNFIKDNMDSVRSHAPYLNLSQEEFLEAVAVIIAIDQDLDQNDVFKRLVYWGVYIQQKESIDLKSELRNEKSRHKYWIKFIQWLRKEFKNIRTITIVVIHGMYTVFVSRVTATRTVDHESMQTLIKLVKQALQKGE